MELEISHGAAAERSLAVLEDVVERALGCGVDALAAPALAPSPEGPAKPAQHALQVAAFRLFALDRLEQRLEVADAEAGETTASIGQAPHYTTQKLNACAAGRTFDYDARQDGARRGVRGGWNTISFGPIGTPVSAPIA